MENYRGIDSILNNITYVSSASQKSFSYNKDPYEKPRVSLPYVNQRGSFRPQEEEDPGFLPTRRQKYLPVQSVTDRQHYSDRYNGEDLQINKRRSNQQYASGFDGSSYEQVDFSLIGVW